VKHLYQYLNKIEVGSQVIKNSFEMLNDDLLFLFERLNIQISLATIFIEGSIPTIPRDLLRIICESLPVNFLENSLPKDIDLKYIIKLIKSLNQTNKIHGFIIDLPPDFMSEQLINLIGQPKIIQVDNEDYLKFEQFDLVPVERELLSVITMLEKTIDSAIEKPLEKLISTRMSYLNSL